MMMWRSAAVLSVLASVAVIAGCGGDAVRDHAQFGTNVVEFGVLPSGGALPEGHPPIGQYHPALPEGHPPVAGLGHGLPPGHPVCPAGQQQLERGAEDGAGDYDAGPQFIST
jgi:hypothetical protein